MIDDMTDQKVRKPYVRRTPPGTVRPVKYGKALAIMVSADLYEAVTVTADENGVSKADVARAWLESGRAAGAGYTDES